MNGEVALFVKPDELSVNLTAFVPRPLHANSQPRMRSGKAPALVWDAVIPPLSS